MIYTSVQNADMARRTVDIAVIIPDAGPVLTLARIERLDLLASFTVPVRIVDQVHYEIAKPENDPKGERCPLGAHIRRTNPREEVDAPGALGSNRHRIIRRGLHYEKDTQDRAKQELKK